MFGNLKLGAFVCWSRALSAAALWLTLVGPVYSQQEVDPAWYDPWAAPSKTIINSRQQHRLSSIENQTRISSATSARESDRAHPELKTRARRGPKQVVVTTTKAMTAKN
jgi:hypothetical protein